MRKSIAFGISLIVLAAFIICSSLGFLPEIGTARLIFTFILGLWAIFGIIYFEWVSFLIPLSFLTMMYKEELNIEQMGNGTIFVVALLLAIGLSIITSKNRKRKIFMSDFSFHNTKNYDRYRNYKETREAELDQKFDYDEAKDDSKKDQVDVDDGATYYDEDVITQSSTLGSSSRYIKSKNLRRVNLSNELGALNVYFDDVTISESGADIQVYCVLGEIKLYIPKEYRIISNVKATLGDVVIDEYPSNVILNTITINGSVELGALRIIRI